MRLPKTMYAYEEPDGDASYLVGQKHIADTAGDQGEKRTVGEYRLVNTHTVEAMVKVTTKK